MKKFISHESEGFLNNEKIEINRSRWESQQVWMTYLRLDVDPEIYLRCLQYLPKKVMPSLCQPINLAPLFFSIPQIRGRS